jgi:hypothetical protein
MKPPCDQSQIRAKCSVNTEDVELFVIFDEMVRIREELEGECVKMRENHIGREIPFTSY